MKNRVKVRLGATLLVTGICMLQTASADGTRSEIEAANSQFSMAAKNGDGAAIAALYASDAQVMPSGSAPIKGAGAIQKFWQGVLDSGIAGADLKTIEIFGRGPTATEVGQYELHDKTGKLVDEGKYIVVWHHVAGVWKMERDMFSTNTAAPKK